MLRILKADMEIAALNKKKKLLLESIRNSIICNVSSHRYYQYFTFKGLDYTRNIVCSLIFLQIFFQRSTTDKSYVQLIKVTAPDGTIPIKPFHVT